MAPSDVRRGCAARRAPTRPRRPSRRRLRARRGAARAARPARHHRGRELLPRWPRRGWHPAGRARPRVDQATPARALQAPRSAWTSSRSEVSSRPPDSTALPRAAFDPDRPRPAFAGPYIVKPRFGGSSIGIEITDDLSAVGALVRTSPHYRSGAVIEPYLADAVDLNIVGADPSRSCGSPRSRRPLRGTTPASTRTRTSTSAERGWRARKRELPASVPESVATAITDAAKRVRRGRPGALGGPHRLPLGLAITST